MLSGAVAGIAEHIAMYPADTLKTRMQALGHPGQQVCTFYLAQQYIPSFVYQHQRLPGSIEAAWESM